VIRVYGPFYHPLRGRASGLDGPVVCWYKETMDHGRQTVHDPVAIRPFDGSRADAEGVLTVERATFDESPYGVEQVQTMLAQGNQHAWLAVQGPAVVGFVIAFLTAGLRGPCWEIDLLAVHPAWRGRRLGSRLIEAAGTYGTGLARQARAVVGDDNQPSAQAFWRTGFRLTPGKYNLLICRPQEASAPPPGLPGAGQASQHEPTSVRRATGPGEVAEWLAGLPVARASSGAALPLEGAHGPTFLLAEQEGQRTGYAELVEVQTLLYRGVWIESLWASTRRTREALIREAVTQVREASLDEIGAMVREGDLPLQRACLAQGFESLGMFRWFTAQLPLPRSAPPSALPGAGKAL
jgi:ribosomal protein S18 acetylase RimI-like enzyme